MADANGPSLSEQEKIDWLALHTTTASAHTNLRIGIVNVATEQLLVNQAQWCGDLLTFLAGLKEEKKKNVLKLFKLDDWIAVSVASI